MDLPIFDNNTFFMADDIVDVVNNTFFMADDIVDVMIITKMLLSKKINCQRMDCVCVCVSKNGLCVCVCGMP